MASLGSRKVRRHNRIALSELPKGSKRSSNTEGKLLVEANESCSSNYSTSCRTQLTGSLVSGTETRSVVSDLMSQKDIFSLYYRPVPQKSKVHSTRHSHNSLTSCSNNEARHSISKHRGVHSSRSCTLSASEVSNSKSGRISQLANRVENLLIQDPKNILHSCNKSQTAYYPVILESSDDSSVSSIQRKSSVRNSSPTKTVLSSPWYRHCRPTAPFPILPLPTTKNCLENEYCCSELYKSSSSSGDDHQEVACEKLFKPVPCYPSSSPLRSNISQVEVDVSQENICWPHDLPLPPSSIPASIDVDLTLMNRSYSLPSPLENNDDESNLISETMTSYSDEITLKPLAPITNILPNGGIFTRRHPKWAADRNAEAHRSNTTVRYPSLNSTLDFNIDSSPPIPSPPPLIVERLPCGLNVSESPDQELLCQSTLNNPHLARPTVLKRGAPDGAEQCTEVADNLELKKVPPTAEEYDPLSTMKRNSQWDFHNEEYSPKKSRVHLLLPSECSAFLPVQSTRQLRHHIHCISPPCLR
uniref:Uncharacterized protein n=1 Tax=Trichobilharzia regenti TaxID=157069 RepID=A0AA85IJL5_TRIRE|nr:unnamed protein product [Trichobilharzia regenti]